MVDAFGHSEWDAATSRGAPTRRDAHRDARVAPRPDARAIFVARGRARDGTVHIARARRVPRETDESRLVMHTHFVDRSRLVSLEGGSPRSRDVNGASRDRASSSIALIDRTKREKTRIEHRKTTNHASRARRRHRRRSLDRDDCSIVARVIAAHRDAHGDAQQTHGENADAHPHITMDVDGGSSARLYVGNIPWSTTIEDLRELFAECGGVTRVDIPTGRQGRSRGYGLVEFNSEAEAQAAVTRMDGA